MTQSSAWTWRKAVATESDLPATTRHVLLTLSLWMNELGEGCYPSISTLVEATGLSNRSIITHLQKAADMGWIIVSQHGFSGQKWRSNEYQAAWPGRPELVQDDQKVVNLTTEGGEPNDKKVVNLTTGGEPNDVKVVNLMTEGGEPNDVKVVKEVHTNSPKNNPINNNPPQAEAKSNFQIRKDLRKRFDEFGMSKPTDDPVLSQFRQMWGFGCQRHDDTAMDAFIAFATMDGELRQAAMNAMPFYQIAQKRQSSDATYRVGLAKWIAKRSWEGMIIPDSDREQLAIERDSTFVSAKSDMALYLACVARKYADSPQKIGLWSGFKGGSFPNQMVVDAQRDIAQHGARAVSSTGPP